MEISLLGNEAPALKWEDNGVTIPEETTVTELEAVLRNFAAWRSVESVALSDILAFADRKGMLEQLHPVFEECDLSPVDVGKALAISNVPRGLRHEKLTAEHYLVVSQLLYPEQTRWLQDAVRYKLTGLQLKRSIEVGRVLKKDEMEELSGRGSGIANYHAAVSQWQRWKTRLGGVMAIIAWPTPILEKWLVEVQEVGADIIAAEAELKKRKSLTEGGAK
jgi:hypothetical protein